jgi:hypothetical protein
MANIAVQASGPIAHGLIKTVWASAFGAADTGLPFRGYLVDTLTVRVTGTATTATLVIEGSTDGVTYQTLHDSDGNDLSFAAASLRTEGVNVAESNLPYIRPRTSGGDGSTALVPEFMAQQRE